MSGSHSTTSTGGNVTIDATGVVSFQRALHLTSGSLTIRGASQIIFLDTLTVDGTGNITLECDEIDFKTGTETVTGHGTTSLYSTSNLTIELASPPAEQTLNYLNITLAEVQALADGSGSIIMTSGTSNGAAAGGIPYDAASAVALSILDAGGTVSVTARNGAITDNLAGETASDLNTKGNTTTLLLSTTTGIGATGAGDLDLRVAAMNRASKTLSGGIYLLEADSLTVGGSGIAASGTDGTIVLELLNGSLTVNTAVASTGKAGNLPLMVEEGGGEATSADVALNAAVSSAKGNVSVLAADSMSLAATGDLTASASGKTVDLKTDGSLAMADGSLIQTANGAVRLEAVAGDRTVGEINAGTAIGTGGNQFDTAVATLAAASVASGTFLDEADALTIGQVSVTANRVATNGSSAALGADSRGYLSSGGAQVFTTANGALVSTASTGEIAAAGNLLLRTGESAEGTAAGITLNATLTSSGGSITVISKDGVSLAAAADLSTVGAGKTIDLKADSSITMADGTTATTNAGNIRLETATATAGDITLGGELYAGTASVSLVSGASVLDGGYTDLEVTAQELRVTAANHLETTLTRLAGTAGSGGFYVDETDALVVGQVSAIAVNRIGDDGLVALAPTDAAQNDLVSPGALVLQTLEVAVSNTSGGGNVSLSAVSDLVRDSDVTAARSGKTVDEVAGGTSPMGGLRDQDPQRERPVAGQWRRDARNHSRGGAVA